MNRPHPRMGGVVMVELVIVLPVILLVMFAIMEFGMMFRTYDILQQAARAAARVAVTGRGDSDGTRNSLIRQEARRFTQYVVGGPPVEFAVRSRSKGMASDVWIDGPGGPCDTVEVLVTYDYKPTLPFVDPLLPEIITMEGAARKMNEPWVRCTY